VNETGYKLALFFKGVPTFLYEPLSIWNINLESKLTTLSVLFAVNSKFPLQKFTSVESVRRWWRWNMTEPFRFYNRVFSMIAKWCCLHNFFMTDPTSLPACLGNQ
jgi:hypothetical protein